MSTDAPPSQESAAVEADSQPLHLLPRLSALTARLQARLATSEASESAIPPLLNWLTDPIDLDLQIGHPEILDRAAGLQRPGAIAVLAWPRLGTRVGLGLENPLAHALVDRLLGFERRDGEERLQTTPVEWGIVTFVVARILSQLSEEPGPLGDWDLVLDRVGPEPFPIEGLGPLVTIRWPIGLGSLDGSVRLWLPAGLSSAWLDASPKPHPQVKEEELAGPLGSLAGDWRAEVGTISLPRGLGRLQNGRVFPIDLQGTLESLTGQVRLVLDDSSSSMRYTIPAEFVPQMGAAHLTLQPPIHREVLPREADTLSQSTPSAEPVTNPADFPITLTVELGRVSLPLGQLASLEPGALIELDRDSNAPIELTSNGRLVARGELVQIDERLGVRITSVFV